MTPEEVLGVLGEPDARYDSVFGESTEGGEWNGRVWLYFGDPDPSLKHLERRRKDLYVFYPPDDGMLLNHWALESSTINGTGR